jgi:enoyl-CoA hydratase/carnithine racemase
MSDVITEVRGPLGLLTLNRPKALNALSLEMVRTLTQALLHWQDNPQVEVIAIRGMAREGLFGSFCAGGDIRFFHQAALAGDPRLEDFFTEEYALNHLVHRCPKPYVVCMDGIVMGGGMGIAGHGAANALRIATERTKMAMPETLIGLFPDVGGGWFLARCPGHVGEYLALTGQVIGGADAVYAGLADAVVDSAKLPALWDGLAAAVADPRAWADGLKAQGQGQGGARGSLPQAREAIDRYFSLPSVTAIVRALEDAGASGDAWAQATAQTLRQRSPLMLHVVLEQVRRARGMTLAEELRMERDMVRHCFHTDHLGRRGVASETVEGIRALAVDKDHAPKWSPARIEAVTPEMVAPFFASPWPASAHPLRQLA